MLLPLASVRIGLGLPGCWVTSAEVPKSIFRNLNVGPRVEKVSRRGLSWQLQATGSWPSLATTFAFEHVTEAQLWLVIRETKDGCALLVPLISSLGRGNC